ncbi:MAG TPA: P1 family peptidase [Candidatus Acidoferrales bacterium]|nr:P1 family peptidase [Candidatus Acidoferrales bacterium]
MLTNVPGIQVGHDTDEVGRTGCTVILCPPAGAIAGVDVRGSAPGTRETDLIQPTALVERINAIVLCGGSAFGLAAADGVMRFLAERGIGYQTPSGPVPIVPAAVIFDLGVGDPRAHPDSASGYRAAAAAVGQLSLGEGLVGAGTGASVGKLLGTAGAMPGGVGSHSLELSAGLWVGALAVVNALGDVIGRDGSIRAGARTPNGEFVNSFRMLLTGRLPPTTDLPGNTTLAVVATNAGLTRAQAQKLAQMAHDGLALAVSPVHTMFDGDTVFALSCGSVETDFLALGAAAVECVRESVLRAVATH